MAETAALSEGEIERILERESIGLNTAILQNRHAASQIGLESLFSGPIPWICKHTASVKTVVRHVGSKQRCCLVGSRNWELFCMAGACVLLRILRNSRKYRTLVVFQLKHCRRARAYADFVKRLQVAEVEAERQRRRRWELALNSWRTLRSLHAMDLFNQRIRSPKFSKASTAHACDHSHFFAPLLPACVSSQTVARAGHQYICRSPEFFEPPERLQVAAVHVGHQCGCRSPEFSEPPERLQLFSRIREWQTKGAHRIIKHVEGCVHIIKDVEVGMRAHHQLLLGLSALNDGMELRAARLCIAAPAVPGMKRARCLGSKGCPARGGGHVVQLMAMNGPVLECQCVRSSSAVATWVSQESHQLKHVTARLTAAAQSLLLPPVVRHFFAATPLFPPSQLCTPACLALSCQHAWMCMSAAYSSPTQMLHILLRKARVKKGNPSTPGANSHWIRGGRPIESLGRASSCRIRKDQSRFSTDSPRPGRLIAPWETKTRGSKDTGKQKVKGCKVQLALFLRKCPDGCACCLQAAEPENDVMYTCIWLMCDVCMICMRAACRLLRP
eukprot:1160256-Pelagomonas_calceolata.AAC.24